MTSSRRGRHVEEVQAKALKRVLAEQLEESVQAAR